MSHIARTSVGFTYRVHSDDAAVPPPLASRVPLLLRTAWKPVGDKLGLVLEYSLNPALAGLASDPLPFQNLYLVATYEGRASSAQTRPPSTHLRDKHMVYWRVADASARLVPGEWHKLVCRISAAPSPAGEAAPEQLKPGRIEARWEYAPPAAMAESGDSTGTITLSKLEEGAEGKGKEKATADSEDDDPFADEQLSPMPSTDAARGRWVDVPLHRKVVSGKYEAV